jgi:hypothetical protein
MHVTRLNLAPPYEYAAIPQQIDHALPSIKGRLAFDRQRRQPPPWPAFHRCKRSEWPIPRRADRVTPPPSRRRNRCRNACAAADVWNRLDVGLSSFRPYP